jgi:TPR repeat protein
MGKVP